MHFDREIIIPYFSTPLCVNKKVNILEVLRYKVDSDSYYNYYLINDDKK